MTHSQKVGSGDARVFATKVLILQMIDCFFECAVPSEFEPLSLMCLDLVLEC